MWLNISDLTQDGKSVQGIAAGPVELEKDVGWSVAAARDDDRLHAPVDNWLPIIPGQDPVKADAAGRPVDEVARIAHGSRIAPRRHSWLYFRNRMLSGYFSFTS